MLARARPLHTRGCHRCEFDAIQPRVSSRPRWRQTTGWRWVMTPSDTSSQRPRHTIIAVVCVVAGVTLFNGSATTALPADQFGVFPTWSTAGSSGAFSATATFVPSAGFPTATLTTNSTTIRAPTGETAWLGDSTAFGQEFGSSRSQPYLSLATAAGTTNSTTTLTFGGPAVSRWGFALGDIDADWVFMQAWQDAARTIPLSVAQLGFQSAGNYCNNTPRPLACNAGPFTDAPVWVTTPETFDGINYMPGTLRGNSLPGAPPQPGTPPAPTAGSGRRSRHVDGSHLRATRRPADLPAVARRAGTKAVISGTVTLTDPPGSPIPPGTTATLNNADGTPVPNIEELPVTTPVAPDGSYNSKPTARQLPHHGDPTTRLHHPASRARRRPHRPGCCSADHIRHHHTAHDLTTDDNNHNDNDNDDDDRATVDTANSPSDRHWSVVPRRRSPRPPHRRRRPPVGQAQLTPNPMPVVQVARRRSWHPWIGPPPCPERAISALNSHTFDVVGGRANGPTGPCW